MNLFMLPYAGGFSSYYNSWKPLFSKDITPIAIEPKGRGTRHREVFYDNFTDAIKDYINQIETRKTSKQYAIYGHSMGAFAAYEICAFLLRNHETLPIHLFLSGRLPPSVLVKKKSEEFSEESIMKQMERLGGTPEWLLQDKKSIAFFVSKLRDDLNLFYNYVPVAMPTILPIPITVMNGKEDCNEQIMKEWEEFSNGDFAYYEFDGGHFFINQFKKEIVQIIQQRLKERKDMTVKSKIKDFVLRYVSSAALKDDDNFIELGLVNSLFFMQLVIFLEKEFSITIENDELKQDNFSSINAITMFIDRKVLGA